jgi:hypothetical protein
MTATLGPDSVVNLGRVVEAIAARTLDYALALAAVGTLTMALLELIKAVGRLRRWFHGAMLERWIGRDAAVRHDLLLLAAGDPTRASVLYDQPSEKMLGQIQAAANVAMDYPDVYPALYQFLATGSAQRNGKRDHEHWEAFVRGSAQVVPTDPAALQQYEAAARESTQARARLGNLVTRKLDTLQAGIDHLWARLNQACAVVGGAALLFAVLPAATAGDGTISAPARVVFALAGGLVAPFAKDVVSALSGLRARR